MPVDTETDVEKVEIVRDEQGDVQRPANTSEQEQTRTAIVAAVDTVVSYEHGNSRDVDGSGYPYTESPAATIRELGFQVVAASAAVEITTTGGDVFTVPIEASGTVLNRWAIDSIKVTDPENKGGRIAWWWAGE